MGGCRCVYRKCQSSTGTSPGLHYFHFPIRDPQRCEQWIDNAQKPVFRTIDRDKLRNKVVCSLHFEEKCFTNEKHDRLIHSAVPTLGFENDTADTFNSLQNANLTVTDDSNIMLIPVDDDNTKFTLPNVEFSGMSYTIFDDAVIPTSKIEEVIIRELQNNKPKDVQVKSVVKKIKNDLPSVSKNNSLNNKSSDSSNYKLDETQNIVFKKFENNKVIRAELKLLNNSEKSNNNIPSYSVSTCQNGDVSVEPSIHIIPDIITTNSEFIPEHETTIVTTENSTTSDEQIELQIENSNEFSMTVVPVSIVENISIQENNKDDTSQESIEFVEKPVEPVEKPQNLDNSYVKMIKNNSKQIHQLKRLVRKQTKLNRLLWQRKQMPNFKPRKLNKHDLIESLKEHVKPSLLAILKLELLPENEIILSDNEEKFITDLYTQNPECYNLLRTKWQWNLPTSEKIDEPMHCSD